MIVGSPNEVFNYNLSSDRVTVERAFGMYVGRWRCLNRANSCEIAHVIEFCMAGCILHNICMQRIIQNRDADELLMALPDDGRVDDYLDRPRYKKPLPGFDGVGDDTQGARLRNNLSDWCQLRGKVR